MCLCDKYNNRSTITALHKLPKHEAAIDIDTSVKYAFEETETEKTNNFTLTEGREEKSLKVCTSNIDPSERTEARKSTHDTRKHYTPTMVD